METSRNLKSDLKSEIKQTTETELPKTPPRCLSESPPRFQIVCHKNWSKAKNSFLNRDDGQVFSAEIGFSAYMSVFGLKFILQAK